MKKILILLMILPLLAGCETTSSDVIPLSKNSYSINVQGYDEVSTRQEMLKKAAQLTLEKGYTHFIIRNPESGSNVSYSGERPIYDTFIYNERVNGVIIPRQQTYTRWESTYSEKAYATAVVHMYHANNRKARHALNAAEILLQNLSN